MSLEGFLVIKCHCEERTTVSDEAISSDVEITSPRFDCEALSASVQALTGDSELWNPESYS
jgi:hypothetical protein